MDPVTGGIISSGIKLLGGLFGGGDDAPTPAQNLMSQAKGARDAAAKYGFNPLTMMQYGQTGGAGGSGGGGLASNELLMGAVLDVADIATGENARRRAAEDLQNDLTRIKIDQARSGVVQVTPQATDGVGTGRAVLGRQSGKFSQSNVKADVPDVPEVKQQQVRQTYHTDGDPVSVTAGIDFDEWAMGQVINMVGQGRQRKRVNMLNQSAAPVSGMPYNTMFSPSPSRAIPQYKTRPKVKGQNRSGWPVGMPNFFGFN